LHNDKHTDISSLPLLVMIHGLGGVLPQFAPVLGSLTNLAACFGLELPGHGRSSFEPKDYEAYTFDAFVALWKTAIEDVCSKHGHNQVVLIGKQISTSTSASLTYLLLTHSSRSQHGLFHSSSTGIQLVLYSHPVSSSRRYDLHLSTSTRDLVRGDQELQEVHVSPRFRD